MGFKTDILTLDSSIISPNTLTINIGGNDIFVCSSTYTDLFNHNIINVATGNNKEEFLAIEYEKLTPILLEAIKEQNNEIKDLKDIVEKQQEQINKLIELNNLNI